MNKNKMAISMLNLALQSEDPQKIKSIIMDAMGILDIDHKIVMKEPRPPSYEEIKLQLMIHRRQLDSIHRPL